MTKFEGPTDRIEEVIRVFQQDVIPWVRDANGFRGFIVLVDRDNDRSLGLTLWASEEEMRASDRGIAAVRGEVAETVGATLKGIEYYEVVVSDSVQLEQKT